MDQLWTRNVAIQNVIVTDSIDQVSNHHLIQVRMDITQVVRGITTQLNPEEKPSLSPKATIKKVFN